MKLSRTFYPVLLLVFLALACVSSCGGGGSGEPDQDPVDYDDSDMELIGSWAGYFLSGANDYTGQVDTPDPMDRTLDGRIFAIGIITREKEVRFVGDVSQFVAAEGSLDISDNGVTKTFSVDEILYYTWDTVGVTHGPGGEDYKADIASDGLEGSTFLTNDFLDGLYWASGTADSGPYWEYMMLNYSASGISPDVSKLAGTWRIVNSFVYGKDGDGNYYNTLELTFDASGNITGTDDLGNSFTGTIDEKPYTASDTVPETEIYTVELVLNPGSANPQTLTGLATYIESMDEDEITVVQSLAIGATNSGYLITGIASKAD